MMIGSVYPNRDAVVVLQVRGAGGIVQKIRAVLDTGFADWLSLPPREISE
jgi:predicted aspartyl protease